VSRLTVDWKRKAFVDVPWHENGGSGKLSLMPAKEPGPSKPIEEIVREVGLYPVEAYQFVSDGLRHTVDKLKGRVQDTQASRHISGRELSEGLREYALSQWGLLARTVLYRWNVTKTEDFGRIVFALVDNGWMTKTDEDSLDDFKDVFDFRTAFERGYRIECKA
jgi:uncharacterized repeat protein (TIGR04138 family)